MGYRVEVGAAQGDYLPIRATKAASAALGVVDPTTWPPSTWIVDFGFHLPYGLATAVAYEAFSGV